MVFPEDICHLLSSIPRMSLKNKWVYRDRDRKDFLLKFNFHEKSIEKKNQATQASLARRSSQIGSRENPNK